MKFLRKFCLILAIQKSRIYPESFSFKCIVEFGFSKTKNDHRNLIILYQLNLNSQLINPVKIIHHLKYELTNTLTNGSQKKRIYLNGSIHLSIGEIKFSE